MRFLPFIVVLGLPLCCGVPTMIGLGAFGAVGGWFADGPGLVVLAGCGILGAAVWLEIRRTHGRKQRRDDKPVPDRSGDDIATVHHG